MIGVAWRGNKAEVLIESPGLVVLRVNRERPDAGNICSLKGAEHCIFEKTGAESLPLPGDRDRETGEQHDRHWMTSQAFGQALGSVVIFDLADHKRVVADDLIIRQGNISLGGVCLLILKCIPRQEEVKSFTPALKCVDCMTALQFFYS